MLLQAGFSPKAVSRRFGHSSEILTVDYYGDNRKIAAIKLDRLEDYIEMVRPDDDQKEDCTNVKIDTDKYLQIAESSGRFCGAKRTRCVASGLL